MSTIPETKQALYDECRAALDGMSEVGDPDRHVGMIREESSEELPAVAIDERIRPIDRGFSGAVQVHDKSYTNGVIDSITYREDLELTAELYVLASDEQIKDDAYERVRSAFRTYVRREEPDQFVADAQRVRPLASRPADRSGSPARGDRLTVEVEFCTFETFGGITPINTVDITEYFVSDPDPAYFQATVS